MFYSGRFLATRWRMSWVVCLCAAESDVTSRLVSHAPLMQKLGVLERLISPP